MSRGTFRTESEKLVKLVKTRPMGQTSIVHKPRSKSTFLGIELGRNEEQDNKQLRSDEKSS
jgi:hypothetical protein